MTPKSVASGEVRSMSAGGSVWLMRWGSQSCWLKPAFEDLARHFDELLVARVGTVFGQPRRPGILFAREAVQLDVFARFALGREARVVVEESALDAEMRAQPALVRDVAALVQDVSVDLHGVGLG